MTGPRPASGSSLTDRPRVRNAILTLLAVGVYAVVLLLVGRSGSIKLEQVVALFAIWGIATVSLNLINGVTGILSLGHHGFMLIGGYVTGLLMLPQPARERIVSSGRSLMTESTLGFSVENLFRAVGLDALATPETLWVRFIVALFVGGLIASLFGLLVGLPALRLRGDYLAIVTFGFGEIIRLLASTSLFAPVTNASLGFNGVPTDFGQSIWWTSAFLLLTVFVMAKLKFSSFGRALMGIREDEIAAEAMGVHINKHKVLAFVLSAFFAGVAGGLYVSWFASARLDLFLFTLMFFFLVAISVGGTGSITGMLLGTALVVAVRQYGSVIEQSYPLTTWVVAAGVALLIAAGAIWLYRRNKRLRPVVNPAVYGALGLGVLTVVLALVAPSLGWLEGSFQGFGLRLMSLSVLLIVIMIFRPEGMMGRAEFSWAWLLRERKDEPTDEERAQDAWLSNPELNREQDDPEPAAHPLTERGERPDGERATGERTPLDSKRSEND